MIERERGTQLARDAGIFASRAAGHAGLVVHCCEGGDLGERLVVCERTEAAEECPSINRGRIG